MYIIGHVVTGVWFYKYIIENRSVFLKIFFPSVQQSKISKSRLKSMPRKRQLMGETFLL